MSVSAIKGSVLAAAACAVLTLHAPIGHAQDADTNTTPAASESDGAAPSANDNAGGTSAFEGNQIALTHKHVKNFIAAQSDLASIAPKIQAAGEKPDASVRKELEGIATRHGFKSFAELDDVAANISIVLAGLDSQSGEFVDPIETLKIELADVKADNTIPAEDKKQLVDELTEAIRNTLALKYKKNVEIVKAHREELEKALE